MVHMGIPMWSPFSVVVTTKGRERPGAWPDSKRGHVIPSHNVKALIPAPPAKMSYSLNSLKGDSIGEYYRGFILWQT